MACALDVRAPCAAQGMFYRATAFNADISSWDVSKGTNMEVPHHLG